MVEVSATDFPILRASTLDEHLWCPSSHSFIAKLFPPIHRQLPQAPCSCNRRHWATERLYDANPHLPLPSISKAKIAASIETKESPKCGGRRSAITSEWLLNHLLCFRGHHMAQRCSQAVVGRIPINREPLQREATLRRDLHQQTSSAKAYRVKQRKSYKTYMGTGKSYMTVVPRVMVDCRE